MKSNIVEILKGFFWGTGFSIAVTLIVSVFFLSVFPSVNDSYRSTLQLDAFESISDMENDYDVSVLDIYKLNDRIRITVKITNKSDDEIGGQGVLIKLFNDNSRFVGSCLSDQNDLVIGAKQDSHLQVDCKLYPAQVKRVVSATAKIKWY